MLLGNQPDFLAKEVQTVWAHIQDERSTVSKEWSETQR